jgi:hypothetical protein
MFSVKSRTITISWAQGNPSHMVATMHVEPLTLDFSAFARIKKDRYFKVYNKNTTCDHDCMLVDIVCCIQILFVQYIQSNHKIKFKPLYVID